MDSHGYQVNALKTPHDQIGPTMYTYPEGYQTPFAVKDEELIFPILVLFPEHTQSNIIQSIAESDTFADILYVGKQDDHHWQTILPSNQGHQEYMEWDEEKQYTVNNVEVWFQEYMVLPYPKEGSFSEDSLRQHFEKQVVSVNRSHVEIYSCESKLYCSRRLAVFEVCDSWDPSVFRLCQECVAVC